MFLFPKYFFNNYLLCSIFSLISTGSTIMSNNNNSAAESHETSNRPACASCKHQRKKCTEGDCVMWRHFPANRMDKFLGVHKVFGISNVTKKIKSLDDDAQQDEAIKSFLWEAKLWQEDPVYGPLGEYKKLEQELKELKEQQRNQQLQIEKLPDVPLPPTPAEPRYLMAAPRAVDSANFLHNQEDYNLLNYTLPNYTTHLQGLGGESQGTVSGSGGGINGFGFGFPMPIEQRQNSFFPRPGFQGVAHQATYNTHVQLEQHVCSYNNMNLLGQGARGIRTRKEHNELVTPSSTTRNVRGRGVGPISSTSSNFVNSTGNNAGTMAVRPSSVGRHSETPISLTAYGRNHSNGDLAAVFHDFKKYNNPDLSGEHGQRDLETGDDSTSKGL